MISKTGPVKRKAERKVLPKIVTSTGIKVGENYCRKCMTVLPATDFFDAVDAGFLDANGLMSICKKCIQGMYDKHFQITGSFEKTILFICKTINVKFSQDAVDSAKRHMETLLSKGKTVNPGFGIYKIKLFSVKVDKSAGQDMTFEHEAVVYLTKEVSQEETPEDMKLFWGDYFKWDDIKFLQNEYNNFKRTIKEDTYPEVTLLKEVCYKLLEIRNARIGEKSTASLVKELQELMKNLAISPNMVSEANGGKAMDYYSKWLVDIETLTPAQWLEGNGHEMFRDVVGPVEQYFQDYFARPLKNLMLTSKDFNVAEETEDSLFDELEAELLEEEDGE
jgi:hypothetical protein